MRIELEFTPTTDAEITCIFCGRSACDVETSGCARHSLRHARVTIGAHTTCLLATEDMQCRHRGEHKERGSSGVDATRAELGE